MIEAQVWKGSSFTIERIQGKTPGTVIFRLCGAFTARDMYGSMTPVELRRMLDFEGVPEEEKPAVSILDLTGVPSMDSNGLGMIASHYVHCRNRGIRLVAAGVNSRVMELFKLTKMDCVIPTVEKAEDVDASPASRAES